MKNQTKEMSLKPGDVVLIKVMNVIADNGKLECMVEKLIEGRDGIVRAVRLRAGKSFLERTIQHLYPMELSCDHTKQNCVLNAKAPEFTQNRPRRRAAMVAGENIRLIANEEEKEQ